MAVVERGTCLGGLAASSGLTEMNAAGFQGAPLYRGIEREVFDRCIWGGHAAYHFAVPMSSNKEVKIDRLRYDPERLKLLLEQLAVEAGITLLYETELTAAREGEEECQITARGPYQEIALSGKYLIDATGNASLVQALGGETEAADERERMIATLMFRISNVDLDQLDAFIHSPRLGETIRQGRESGVLKGGILAFTPIPGTRDVSLNVTRAKFDHEDLADATRGMGGAEVPDRAHLPLRPAGGARPEGGLPLRHCPSGRCAGRPAHPGGLPADHRGSGADDLL